MENLSDLPEYGQFRHIRAPRIMKAENIQEIRNNDVVRKRLAKYMALCCFRNTELENLHAGKYPSSKKGDFSDVKVISPSREIPWTELSRFSDEEMKVLMIDVVNHCYAFLESLYIDPWGDKLIEVFKTTDPRPEWNEPTYPRYPA